MKENPLYSILFNILLPVTILNQLTKRLGENGPLIALGLALAFPIGYGVWDYLKHRHKNYVSLFGLLSVSFTGGFALLKLEGIWFAVKEAAFPGLMAIGVFLSSFGKNPLVRTLFCNPQVLHMDVIEGRLREAGRADEFHRLTQIATRWLALSFVISAILNYFIAVQVFTPIGDQMGTVEHSLALNQQIAKMTGMGFIAIALPMMVFTGTILYLFLRRVSALVKVDLNDLVKG